MTETIERLTKDEEKKIITTLLKGKSLKNYTPVNYLKNLKDLFNIEFITYSEMLYLVFLDVNGSVKSSVKFRPEFLNFLFNANYKYIASKIKGRNEYIIVDRANMNTLNSLFK